VPGAGSGRRRVLGGDVEVREHAVLVVADVPRGAPQVTHPRPPAPRLVRAPFADAEHDGPPRLRQGVAELGVLRRAIEALGVAPIFLDVVHAPFAEGARVQLLGAVGPGTALARHAPPNGLAAEPAPPPVHVAGERLDAAG